VDGPDGGVGHSGSCSGASGVFYPSLFLGDAVGADGENEQEIELKAREETILAGKGVEAADVVCVIVCYDGYWRWRRMYYMEESKGRKEGGTSSHIAHNEEERIKAHHGSNRYGVIDMQIDA
jgi:hypothetical protein